MIASDEDIIAFSSYRDVKDQYTNDFIKGSLAVKKSEDEEGVSIYVSENAKENIIASLQKFHRPLKAKFIRVSQDSFAEFIGSFVESAGGIDAEARDGEDSISDVSVTADVVNIANTICLKALREKASDIHIQCSLSSNLIRYRIMGDMVKSEKTYSKALLERVVSRLKVMAGLDITKRNAMQEGRIRSRIADEFFDARVSVMPVLDGESMVLRLFERDIGMLSFDNLFFKSLTDRETEATLNRISNLKSGLVLITGPTGCGKTTTLHAVLFQMQRERLKIVTVEDPVERVIPHVDQIQVDEKHGLGFANILRNILRQDPDVIMVGEIRDEETAELALRAALTGHLVLSTLHTESAVSAITRLLDLGIRPYLLSSTLRYCMSQRLVKVKKKQDVGQARKALAESFEITDTIASMIYTGKGEKEIGEQLIRTGYKTIRDRAFALFREGSVDMVELKKEGIIT